MAKDLRDTAVEVTMADGSFRIEKDGMVTERTVVDGVGYTVRRTVVQTNGGEGSAMAFYSPETYKEMVRDALEYATVGTLVLPVDELRDAAPQRANALADECGRLKSELERVTKERDGWEVRARRAEGKR